MTMMPRLVPTILTLCLTVAAALSALPVQAHCAGQDLVAAMPDAERAALRAEVAAVPYSRGNLWRATRGGQVIDIVGTYHLDDPRHDLMMERVAPMLDNAVQVLVEAGPEEEALLAETILARPEFMFLTDGPTLPEMLPEADWQDLVAAMRARGVPPAIASRFRPWYMAMLLNIPPCAMPDLAAGAKGLDHRIIAAALERGLPVAALEPHDTLFGLFKTLTPEAELDLIRTSLLLEDRSEDMTATLANAYFAGESWLIWLFTLREARRQPGITEEVIATQFGLVEDVLMIARNRAWIPVLTGAAAQAEGRGSVLAAAGALHLPGPEGILALLAAEGFTVEPL